MARVSMRRLAAACALVVAVVAVGVAGALPSGDASRAPLRARVPKPAVRVAAPSAAAIVSERSSTVPLYRAPPERRTWEPFTYSPPAERRECVREFARALRERHNVAPNDPLPPLPAMRVVLLGGPCSGKGTIAPMLSQAFRTRVLGVGELLRGEVRAGTPRGAQAAEAMASGKLLPDDLVLELLLQKVQSSRDVYTNGWLLDGFPRTQAQAAKMLADPSGLLRPDLVLQLDRPAELIREFALGRMTDAATGCTYHPEYAPPPEEVLDRLVWRVDDTPAVIDARIEEYKARIEPIIATFADAGVPYHLFDNARSELATFDEVARDVERSATEKLSALGGRDAFREATFGPAVQATAKFGVVGATKSESDVQPICDLNEAEEECLVRWEEAEKNDPVDPLVKAVHRCNDYDPSRYVPVLVGSEQVGWASNELVEQLAPQLARGRTCALVDLPDAGADSPIGGPGAAHVALELAPLAQGLEERTAVMEALVSEIVQDGVVPRSEIRNELQDVRAMSEGFEGATRSDPPLLRVERAAIDYLGVPSYGVHVNGYVCDAETGRAAKVWIGKRSMSKATYPGLFDQMVAGGQPSKISFMENVRKECEEEASLPPDVVARVRPAGLVSYRYSTRIGLSTKVLATFDVPMPEGMVPICADGEVDDFRLMSVEEALDSIRTQLPLWKPNSALVMIDFAMRHGFLCPDDRGYAELAHGMRGAAACNIAGVGAGG